MACATAMLFLGGLGLNGGIGRFDLESEKPEWLLDIETTIADNRSNDGYCDSSGRLSIGTMQMDFKKGAERRFLIRGLKKQNIIF